MNIWLVGGGTAGHVLSLVALASELKHRGHSTVLVVDRAHTAQRIAQAGGDWSYVITLFSGKLRRYQGRTVVQTLLDLQTLLLNIRDVLYVGIGFAQSMIRLMVSRPDVIFINGGAVGVPVATAARIFKVPYVVHESDAAAGLANKLIAGKARRILLGLAARADVKNETTFITGIPSRDEYKHVLDQTREQCKKTLGFDPAVPLVVVTGGSQGSQRLNDVVTSQAEVLLGEAQVIHIAGPHHEVSVRSEWEQAEAASATKRTWQVFGFVGEMMPTMLRAADVVVARSGASTIADLALLAVPTILIPNPDLDRHQGNNARMLASADAAILMNEVDIQARPALLTDTIRGVISDKHWQQTLSQGIQHFSHPNATANIASHIIEAAQPL